MASLQDLTDALTVLKEITSSGSPAPLAEIFRKHRDHVAALEAHNAVLIAGMDRAGARIRELAAELKKLPTAEVIQLPPPRARLDSSLIRATRFGPADGPPAA